VLPNAGTDASPFPLNGGYLFALSHYPRDASCYSDRPELMSLRFFAPKSIRALVWLARPKRAVGPLEQAALAAMRHFSLRLRVMSQRVSKRGVAA
jgi:hypothetical protein